MRPIWIKGLPSGDDFAVFMPQHDSVDEFSTLSEDQVSSQHYIKFNLDS